MRFTQAFGGVETGDLHERLKRSHEELARAHTRVHELSLDRGSRPGAARRLLARLRR